MGEYLFFAWLKKRYQKKGHPAVLAFGCSVRFSLQRTLRNSLRSDSPRAIPLYACSARQHKRDGKIKIQVNTESVTSDQLVKKTLTPYPLYRRRPISRICKEWIPARTMPE